MSDEFEGMGEQGVNNLVAMRSKLIEQKTDADDRSKFLGKQIASIESAILNAMDAAGMESCRIDGVNYSRQEIETFKASHPDIPEWLREIGEGGMLKESVNYQTFGAFCRNRLRDGLEVPAFIERNTVVRLGERKA